MPDRPPKRDRSPADADRKACPACGRPFENRRKWRGRWDGVVYCSERCRRSGRRGE